MGKIYLDYNATTPLEESVIEIIHKELRNAWANPSSNYPLGKTAKDVIELSRKQLAEMLRTDPAGIIFTSGGTESSNMAILSAIKHNKKTEGIIPHIITTSVEHDATLQILHNLKEENEIDLSVVKPFQGMILKPSILDSINEQTCLISIMLANNETGVLFPVSEIGKQLEFINEKRKKKNLPTILLHTDAAQVIGKLPVHAEEIKADFITIAGHKVCYGIVQFYGPKIGCLYFKRGAPIYPIFYGGGQEKGLRPGTENAPMIAGLGEAARLVSENLIQYNHHMQSMRDLLQEKLMEKFPKNEIIVNFTECDRLPNTLSISLMNRNSRSILNACENVMASTGSACHSSNLCTSRVVKDCLDEKLWNGTLRLSVGRETTHSEILSAVEDLYCAFVKTAPIICNQ